MKVLTTGACGFAGSTLAEGFLKSRAGLKIFGIDNLSRKGSETNVPRLEKMGVEFFRGDIRSMEDLNRLPAADWVPLILKQIDEPLKTVKPRTVNLGGGSERSLSLAELANWCEKRLGRKKTISSQTENRKLDVPYYVTDKRLAEQAWDGSR